MAPATERSRYETMETEQLEAILRTDACASGNGLDLDTLLCIMDILATRQRKRRLLPWRAYKRRIHRRRMPMWMRHAVAVAAMVALLLMIPVGSRAGLEEGELYPRWTGTYFYYEGRGLAEPVAGKGVFTGFDSLPQMMQFCGRSSEGAPRWIPEGFTGYRLEANINDAVEDYLCFYTNDQRSLSVGAQVCLNPMTARYYVDGNTLRIYRYADRDYYIFHHAEQLCVFWSVGPVEYHVSGDLTMNQVIQIIRSTDKR